VAAEARARLASMSSESRGATGARIAVQNGDVIFRKIGFAGQGRTHLARLSPDGARMLYVDRKGKEPHDGLYEVELSSGKEKRLVDGVSALTLLYFEWSPDGKNIIYKYGRAELRVISSDGGEPKTFWSSPDQKSDVYPMDWSRDGRYILCTIENGAEGALQLAILSSSGGEPRTVAKIPLAEWASYPQFSPDGKFIVGAKTVQGNTDLYVWAVNGGQEIRLTDHPAKDDSPFWSPDGRYIVFMSDREKTRDLWALSMQGAKPEGAPIRVKSNIGKNTWVTDYTQSGVLTMLMVGEGASSDLFVMPVSPMTGDPQGQLLPFAKYPTDHGLSPALSPDGKSVAYTSRKGELSLPRIFISSGNMKADEEIPTPNYFVANIEWSGDGQSLVFPGWDPEGQLGIFRVSLKDCRLESLQLAGKRGPGNVGAFLNLRWLPYANTFRFEKLGNKNKIGEVYTMDRDGKNIRLVSDKISADVWTWPAPNGKYLAYVEGRDLKVWSLQENRLLSTLVRFSEGKPYEGPAWSPDGNKVAFKDQKQLKVCSLPDSASRVLVEAGANSELGEVPWSGGLAWSHDGRIIAYSVRDLSPGSNPRSELWVVPATGGTPRKIADAPATHPRLGQILWHPSGEMIFVSGAPEDTQPRTYEHWALENFLPKRNSGK
jgi:Tol biopolymer transport system component